MFGNGKDLQQGHAQWVPEGRGGPLERTGQGSPASPKPQESVTGEGSSRLLGEHVEPVHGAGGGRDREVAGTPGLQAEGRGSLGQRPAPVHQVIL